MKMHVSWKVYMLRGLFSHNSLDQSISNSKVSDQIYYWSDLLSLCLIEIPVVNANSVTKTLSDTVMWCLHCLPITFLAVSKLKWLTLRLTPKLLYIILFFFPKSIEVPEFPNEKSTLQLWNIMPWNITITLWNTSQGHKITLQLFGSC